MVVSRSMPRASSDTTMEVSYAPVISPDRQKGSSAPDLVVRGLAALQEQLGSMSCYSAGT